MTIILHQKQKGIQTLSFKRMKMMVAMKSQKNKLLMLVVLPSNKNKMKIQKFQIQKLMKKFGSRNVKESKPVWQLKFEVMLKNGGIILNNQNNTVHKLKSSFQMLELFWKEKPKTFQKFWIESETEKRISMSI